MANHHILFSSESVINTHHPLPKIQVHFPWQNDKNHQKSSKISITLGDLKSLQFSHHSQNSFTWESCWERPQPTNPQPGLAWHRPVTCEKCWTSYARKSGSYTHHSTSNRAGGDCTSHSDVSGDLTQKVPFICLKLLRSNLFARKSLKAFQQVLTTIANYFWICHARIHRG